MVILLEDSSDIRKKTHNADIKQEWIKNKINSEDVYPP